MKRSLLATAGMAATIAALALAGCSSSSGGGTTTTTAGGGGGEQASITALTVADKVSVVDAQSQTSKVTALTLAGVLPTDSDYSKDKTFTYVHDRTTEAFRTVNEILCMMGQTKYDAMLNKGAYKALVNEKLCKGNDSTDNAGGSQQAGSSASDAPEYETWTVKATRPDNNSSQTLEVWVHEKGRQESGGHVEPEKIIQAKAVITESASTTNPYGLFTMNFAGYPATNGVQSSTTPMFKGLLKAEKDQATGKVLLKFTDEEASGKFKEAATIEKNSNGTGGGKVYEYQNFEQLREGTIDFAYNGTLFHRKDDKNIEACLDRSNFETSAWRYGMYDATAGSRINVNSGFPINTKQDGSGQHGWVGFWGLWVPDGVTIANGQTIYKQNYGPDGGTASPYTVAKVGGKLKKHTKFATTLGAIKNIPLEGNLSSGPTPSNTTFRVIWNGSALVKTASATMTPGAPPSWTDITPAQAIDTTQLPFGELNFWSQSLGGQVRVKLGTAQTKCEYVPGVNGAPGHTSCPAPTADTAVVYFTENIVYPGDATAPAALSCYDNCPKAGANGMDGTSRDTMTYPMANDPAGSSRHDYTVANLLLMDGANPVLLTSTPQEQQWGFNSGPLFQPTTANLAKLACDWNPAQTCGWKAWSELDEFFTWETGPNNWNQLTALKDPTSGEPLKFEQPLRVEYTHQQASSKYNGTKFFLDYNGFGELHGIPGKCVDMSNGTTVNNCSGPNIRWVPEFTIPEGSAASYTKGGTTYNTVIKPLEMEQRMVKLDSASCSALALTPAQYSLPQISEWTDPALGTEPTVTAAPAVIGGVLQ